VYSIINLPNVWWNVPRSLYLPLMKVKKMCKLKVFENMVRKNTLQSQEGELIKLDGDVFRIRHHKLNIIKGIK
jgi:hypothetical protein